MKHESAVTFELSQCIALNKAVLNKKAPGHHVQALLN